MDHPIMKTTMGCSKNNGIIHLVLFPLMAQGHLIPMLDIAKLLTQQSNSIKITIFSTTRCSNSQISNPQINLLLLQNNNNNLNLDIHSNPLSFFSSLALDLHPRALALSRTLSPKPTCIISDLCLPWTLDIANALRVPWVSFSGGSCFGSVVMRKIMASGICARVDVGSDEYFEVPGLVDRVEMSKAQLPAAGLSGGMRRFIEEIGEAERKAYGMIVNSFEELEGYYVGELKKVKKDRVWCVGPVSLCNKHHVDQAQRGKASTEKVDEQQHMMMMKWLDSQEPKSVVYICLGSLHNLNTPQLIELGLGLESSNTPFIWVVRASDKLEKWIQEEGFEERIMSSSSSSSTKARRGVIIRDWAPQLLILSHPSIGGFLTHCGWNSILEGVSAGLPMLTWPLFSDQFLNEKLVVNVLKIGVKVGAEYPVMKMKEEGEGEEEEEEMNEVMMMIKKEAVREGIERLMGKGDHEEEAEERRKKARELGVMAKNALEDGGSSQLNIRLFIDDIVKISS